MARPRKPTAVLELTGAYKKNPQRRRSRENEPQPSGPLGDPPESLGPEVKAMWREIASELAPGVATNSDRKPFETLSRICASERAFGIGGRSGITAAELSQKTVLFSKFGMTPSDRAKIAVPKQDEEDNPFSEIADEAAADRVQ